MSGVIVYWRRAGVDYVLTRVDRETLDRMIAAHRRHSSAYVQTWPAYYVLDEHGFEEFPALKPGQGEIIMAEHGR